MIFGGIVGFLHEDLQLRMQQGETGEEGGEEEEETLKGTLPSRSLSTCEPDISLATRTYAPRPKSITVSPRVTYKHRCFQGESAFVIRILLSFLAFDALP